MRTNQPPSGAQLSEAAVCNKQQAERKTSVLWLRNAGMCYKTKLTSVSRLVTWACFFFSCRIWNKLNLKIKLGTGRPLCIIPPNGVLRTHRTDFKEKF